MSTAAPAAVCVCFLACIENYKRALPTYRREKTGFKKKLPPPLTTTTTKFFNEKRFLFQREKRCCCWNSSVGWHCDAFPKRAARSSCAGRSSISLTVDVVIHKVLLEQLFNTILSLYPLCL